MRFRRGLVLTLAAGLFAGGCAAGASGGGGPSVSPTGKTYPPGTPPSESSHTTPAKLFIAQGQFEQALQEAQQAVAADSTNPQHYFLLGQAYVGLDNYAAADSAWDIAERIYPAYELDIEPERESAWAEAFNEGVNAYNAGDMETATEVWQRANTIYTLRPEAYQNLAAVYTQAGDYEQAIEAYRNALAAIDTVPATRVLDEAEIADRAESRGTIEENLAELLLFTDQYAEAEELYRQQLEEDPENIALQGKLAASIAAQEGRAAEAQAIYNELLGRPDLDASTLMDIGVVLFQSEDFPRAAEAFERLTQLRPNSRDAWYNRANALYAAENWEELVPVAERLIELDPLNYDASLILARAYRDSGQNDAALQELQRMDANPIKFQKLETRQGAGRTTVRGEVVGNQASAGSQVQVEFTFYGDDGAVLGTQTASIPAPAKDATAPFEVVFETETPASGYSYELAN